MCNMSLQMKKFALPAAACVTLFALAACDSGGPGIDYDRTVDDGSVEQNTPTDSPASSRDTSPSNSNASQPWQNSSEQKKPSTATSKPKYPKGIGVANKKGFVKSPYAQYEGLVDVRGFPSGTLVKCPYTSKIFVVP